MRLPDSPQAKQGVHSTHSTSSDSHPVTTSDRYRPTLHERGRTRISNRPPRFPPTGRHSLPTGQGQDERQVARNSSTGWRLSIVEEEVTYAPSLLLSSVHTTSYPTSPPAHHQEFSSGPPPHSMPLYSCIPLPEIEEGKLSLHPILGHLAHGAPWQISPSTSSDNIVGDHMLNTAATTSAVTGNGWHDTEETWLHTGEPDPLPCLTRRLSNIWALHDD